MTEKNLYRAGGLFLLAIGVPSLYLAGWGYLWRADLAPFTAWERLLLRPALGGVGATACALGLWYAWMRWTTFGRALCSWRERHEAERLLDGWRIRSLRDAHRRAARLPLPRAEDLYPEPTIYVLHPDGIARPEDPPHFAEPYTQGEEPEIRH